MSEASLNAQIEALGDNIDALIEGIEQLIKKEGTFKYKFKFKFLTKRQFAKKMLIAATPSPDDEETRKAIHMTVYGKYLVENGQLIDDEVARPDCVETRKGKNFRKPMDERHPMLKETYKKMTKELKNSINRLSDKVNEISEQVKHANIQIVTATSAIATSATIQPAGSGIPVAVTAAQSIVTTVFALIAKVGEILPFLGPLMTIPLLIAAEAIEGILIGVNMLLSVINITVATVVVLKRLIVPVASAAKLA